MAGSAVRRRQRMLRSMWRHEQMAIKLALAEKLHHSACRPVLSKKEEVEQVRYNALLGQKTARAGGSLPAPLSADHDPVIERPAKRFRITGKSSAIRHAVVSG